MNSSSFLFHFLLFSCDKREERTVEEGRKVIVQSGKRKAAVESVEIGGVNVPVLDTSSGEKKKKIVYDNRRKKKQPKNQNTDNVVVEEKE